MVNGVDAWGLGLANAVWPWLAIAVLAVGALLTLASGLAPLRGLGLAWRSLSSTGRDRVVGPDGGRALALPLAAAAGMGGITGATLAITAGGPGALPWMWIATVLGMGVSFAEGALGSRAPGREDTGLLSGEGLVGKLLAPLSVLSILAVAVLAGAMLQTHQAAAVLQEALWVPPPSASVGMAMAAIVFVFWPGARLVLLRLVPAVLLLFALSAAIVAFADVMFLQMRIGDAFNAAFGLGAAAGGTAGGVVAVALHHGVLRATLGGHAGLGTAGLAGLRTHRPAAAGAVAMLVPPLTAGVLGTLSALVLMTGAGPSSLTEPTVAAVAPSPAPPPTPAPDAEQPDAVPDADPAVADTDPSFGPLAADPRMVPLERTISRGLRPSQQVGQTIVMPDDIDMESGEHYAVLLRSDPRGHATAKLDAERNAVILPAWQVADDVHEVIFHAREKDQTGLAAWDVRIPCDREVRAPSPGAKEFLKLTPKDPNLDLQALVTRLRLSPQAYVPLSDYHFVGRVGRATTGDLGSHLAMYEPSNEARPFNPKLHEFFRNNYRGPYADDAAPRPPFAFLGEPTYQPRVGSIVRLALQGHPRGEPLLSVTRGGNLEAPPWTFLMQAQRVVLRHDTDPSKDVHVQVTPRYEDYRIHLDVADPTLADFTRIAEGWHGPFLAVPDFEFDAEVRGDTRLPDDMKGRRVLIPVHPLSGPQGPYGDVWPYAPHPGDVVAAGMHGPVLAAHGTARLAVRFSGQLGAFGTMSIVVCTVVLALGALVAWTQLAQRAATPLMGPTAAKAMPVVLLAFAGAGTWVSLTQLVAVLDVALAFAVAINLVGLAFALPKVIALGRDLGARRT